ncbi:hypothetical protein [Methanoregula sp.]|jgi:hypothetical protein|uniref:hypothetical protein n=1 Tax=Methanoregula sp. TaxID=2052170 RepID=UPI003C186454
MYLISPRDFSQLNADISNEIEKVLLKFVVDGKIKVITDAKQLKSATGGKKRKRGRPRKVINVEKIGQIEKRPRGRPRKIKTPDTKAADGPKRKRGRPRKNVILESEKSD